jgi:iron-sulfur cluster repair protein YtfE (RIC family)
MEGDPSFEDKINYLSKLLKENYLKKLIKEEKIYFDTITKHRELANDTFDNILKKGGK